MAFKKINYFDTGKIIINGYFGFDRKQKEFIRFVNPCGCYMKN